MKSTTDTIQASSAQVNNPTERSFEQAAVTTNERPPHVCHGQRWGRWKLDGWKYNLDFRSDCNRYSIDLAGIGSSAKMLDWIFQFKGRGDAQDLDDLIDAFGDIFWPQSNLCSSGQDKRIDPRKFLRAAIEKRPTSAEGR